ncbi:hypothetical protein V1524DRAFT_424644, partial [Lipomyces starkeyi]
MLENIDYRTVFYVIVIFISRARSYLLAPISDTLPVQVPRLEVTTHIWRKTEHAFLIYPSIVLREYIRARGSARTQDFLEVQPFLGLFTRDYDLDKTECASLTQQIFPRLPVSGSTTNVMHINIT